MSESGKKILLFGLGQGAEECEKIIKKEHSIIGYTDSFSEIEWYNNKPFYKISEINNVQFDYIVITLRKLAEIGKIINTIVEEQHINPEKVVSSWYALNRERWRYKLKNYDLESIETIIFGNSHALYGFLEKKMLGPTINFAVNGADIFHTNVIINEILDKYSGNFPNLKNVIVDLYDYHYFNVDVSRGNVYDNFLQCGGCITMHHRPYTDFMGQEYVRGQSLFVDELMGTELYENDRWTYIRPDAPLDKALNARVVQKKNMDTIRENESMLDEMLAKLRCWKPQGLNLIFTLIPRYLSMENAEEELMQAWKKDFFERVEPICAKYGVKFWNYKQNRGIYSNNCFYGDICHLNTIGGNALTSVLCRDLLAL